jgi:hypothetical protein
MGGLQPGPERCDIEVSSAVWCDSLAGAFSTLTSLRKRGPTFQIAVREASHALELNKSAPTGYERLRWLSGCLTQ